MWNLTNESLDEVEEEEGETETLTMDAAQGSTSAQNVSSPSESTLNQQPSSSGSTATTDKNIQTSGEDVSTSKVPLCSESEDGASGTASSGEQILECPICLQACIHPARLPCGHIFCFLCVKGVAYKNRRCAMCRREIPPEFLDHPQLVNGIEDICSTKATEDGYQWFYEGRNGWWQYDDRTSQDIEEAFKEGEKSCTILVAGYVYLVDLEAMLQQRQNEPTRCRRVKRDLASIPKKGVAGLRIEGNTVITDSNFASQIYQNNHQLSSEDNTDLSLDLGPSTNYGTRLSPHASDFISTIAATDAAIRIASDIIGSTLAHADELSRSATLEAPINGENRSTTDVDHDDRNAFGPPTVASSIARGSQDLLGAAEDLLDATQYVISEADQQTIDLFEQTLNDFHALTLRNVIDSSDEDDASDTRGLYSRRQIRF